METLIKKFEKMGARAKVTVIPDFVRGRNRRFSFVTPQRTNLNIDRDKTGPFYSIRATESTELTILDVQPKDRHLVLMARFSSQETGEMEKAKFLCGHDERDWFIATIPDNRPVSSVVTAKEALKPEWVLAAQEQKQVSSKRKNRRHNEAFIRQGEWFFVPAPEIDPLKWLVLENEPMRRGRGKPHTAEFLYRIGGSTVYVSPHYPKPLLQAEFEKLRRQQNSLPRKQRSELRFEVRRLDPTVYVRGRITHADHKTVLLDGWHRVLPNTETSLDNNGNRIVMGFID